MSEHFSVTVIINKVSKESKAPAVRGAVPPSCPDERHVEQIVQLTSRASQLADAVRKTIEHLNVEIDDDLP